MTFNLKGKLDWGKDFNRIDCVFVRDYETDYLEIANCHLTQQQMLFQSPEVTACLQRRDASKTLSCRDTHE